MVAGETDQPGRSHRTTEIFFNVPSALLFASTSEALVSLDGGVSLESSPSSATFGGGFGPALGAAQRFSVEAGAGFSTQQVFGYGVLDLQQGAFQGGLELVLGSSQGASESRYLGVYSAAVQNGAFGPSASLMRYISPRWRTPVPRACSSTRMSWAPICPGRR